MNLSNLEHLTEEHAYMLRNVLSNEEADIQRLIARVMGAARMPAEPRLGHRSQHKPKLHLGDYLESQAEAPSRVHRGLFKGYSNILANDQWGDCGEAMAVHGIEGIHHAAGTPVPNFTPKDTTTLYSEVTGFVESAGPPGNNPTDNGTDNGQLVEYWQTNGVRCAADNSVHKITESVAIDGTNDLHCQIGVYEFAVLFTAWALPISAQGQSVWDVVGDGQTGNSAPGGWGGHDTATMAYSGDELDTDTWGIWTPVTKKFRLAYQMGFFVVLSEDMRRRSGVSPTGLNWTKLNSDLDALSSGSVQ